MVLILLSPAKTLTWEPVVSGLKMVSLPPMIERSDPLVDFMKSKSASEIKALLGISQPLAATNYTRFQSFKKSDAIGIKKDDLRPGAFAYDGPAFQGFEARSMTNDELQYAQKSLCILSGLYGVVRALDLIQPYRLCMGTKIQLPGESKAKRLDEYWRDSNTAYLLDTLTTSKKGSRVPLLVDVASGEYSKSVDFAALKSAGACEVVKCTFHDDGRVNSFLAKRARGLMARFIVKNKVEVTQDLQKFDYEGYTYSSTQSTSAEIVFERSKNVRLAAVPVTSRGGAKASAAASNEEVDNSIEDIKEAPKSKARAKKSAKAEPVNKKNKKPEEDIPVNSEAPAGKRARRSK